MPGAIPPAVLSSPFRAEGHSGFHNQVMTVNRFTAIDSAIEHSTPKSPALSGSSEKAGLL
jgi:hypothetical protein